MPDSTPPDQRRDTQEDTRLDSTLHKVTAYVTRGKRNAAELLVFRHPNAGFQLPAGTVETPETPAAAAVREVFEETGVTARHPALLTTERTPQDAGSRVLVTASRLLKGPSGASGATGLVLRRGQPCRVLSTASGFAEIRVEEYDLDTHETLQRYSGWLPQHHLATSIERAHFHLTGDGHTGSQWTHWAEDRFHFECFWAPLAHVPELAGQQQGWLKSCQPLLDASLRE